MENSTSRGRHRTRRIWRVIYQIIACVLAGTAVVCMAQGKESTTSTHLDLYQATEWDTEGRVTRKDFRLPNGSIWVRNSGEWHVEEQISHPFLLCGTYRVGVHFGIGQPGCTGVQWLSDLEYISSETHCNQATRLHIGNGATEALKAPFGAISCVERTILCTGRCR